MGPTSSDGDLAPEELQRNATAAPLNTDPHRIQAMEFGSQPVQHGIEEGKGQTCGIRRHDPASGTLEAPDADVRANTKEDEHSSANESVDDSSIDSDDINQDMMDQPYDFRDRQGVSTTEKYKRQGTKYARVVSIYSVGLENRVSGIERELLELQYEFGSKERPDSHEERRVIHS